MQILCVTDNSNHQKVEEIASKCCDAVTLSFPRFPSQQDKEFLFETMREREFDYVFNVLGAIIYPEDLVKLYWRKLINFHPATPKYPGVGSAGIAMYRRDPEFGATCHFISQEIDAGAIICVQKYNLRPKDSRESISSEARRLSVELFSSLLSDICNGKIPQEDPKLRWSHRAFSFADLREQMTQDVVIDPDQVDHLVKSFYVRGSDGPFLRIGNHLFGYSVDDD